LVESSARAGQPVELQDEAGPLPPFTARVAYRVVQEGLTNAGKHAPGAATTVSVQRDGHDVVVTVANAASARLPLDLPGAGAGLVGLAERVRLAGGSLDSGPSAGGWRLRAVIPWVEAGIEETIPL
jgi:signal transduction histidine kinase